MACIGEYLDGIFARDAQAIKLGEVLWWAGAQGVVLETFGLREWRECQRMLWGTLREFKGELRVNIHVM
jgi:hypothetical protein